MTFMTRWHSVTRKAYSLLSGHGFLLQFWVPQRTVCLFSFHTKWTLRAKNRLAGALTDKLFRARLTCGTATIPLACFRSPWPVSGWLSYAAGAPGRPAWACLCCVLSHLSNSSSNLETRPCVTSSVAITFTHLVRTILTLSHSKDPKHIGDTWQDGKERCRITVSVSSCGKPALTHLI